MLSGPARRPVRVTAARRRRGGPGRGFGPPLKQETKLVAQFDRDGNKRHDAEERQAAREFQKTNRASDRGGRRLLLASDRDGANNLYAVDLSDGVLTQLTAFPAGDHSLYSATVNHRRGEVVFWLDDEVMVLDLQTLTQRTLWHCPSGFEPHQLTIDADGGTVYTAVNEGIQSSRVAYEGYRERFASKPLSRVMAIPLAGKPARVLHEDRAWITHVNASPTAPGSVVFCHEGPWDAVQRMWGLDARSERVWPIRPRDGIAGIGHEYWLKDGKRLGYHARIIGDDRRHLLGFVGWDDHDRFEAEIPVPTQHSHANDERLVVMDSVRWAGDLILLAVREGAAFAAPRVLCNHGTSRHHHRAHAHPRLSPDGRHVVFTTDRSGYCQVHLAEVPMEPLQLPKYTRPPLRFYWM